MAHPKRRGGSSKVMSRMQQSQVLVELEAWMERQPFFICFFLLFLYVFLCFLLWGFLDSMKGGS